MKHYLIVLLLFFLACANSTQSSTNYIGVNIPDFDNPKIDSLVQLYETDREAFYKAQEAGDMSSYYKSKVGKKGSYNVTGFYDDVIGILNKEGKQEELTKFQEYMKSSTARAKAFIERNKK